MSTGERFEEERKRIGKTQGEIADLVGLTRRTIGRIENENAAPDSELLGKLAPLGVDTQYIITGIHSANLDRVADEPAPYKTERGVGVLSPAHKALIEKYDQCTPADRTRIQAIIDALASAAVKKPKKAG